MSTLTDLAQLVAAGGLGSLLTQFVSRSGERRHLRAAVRIELSTIERLCWLADISDSQDEERSRQLREARRRLHTAAMVAHLPREITEEYDRIALALRQACKERIEAGHRGSAPLAVTDCADEAFQLMCDLLWRPMLTRLMYRRRMNRLRQMVAENREKPDGRCLRWAYAKP